MADFFTLANVFTLIVVLVLGALSAVIGGCTVEIARAIYEQRRNKTLRQRSVLEIIRDMLS
jgi:hypothetical protein